MIRIKAITIVVACIWAVVGGAPAVQGEELLVISGQPLEIRADEFGTIGLYQWQNGELVKQYFGGDAGTATTLTMTNSTTGTISRWGDLYGARFTSVSHTMPDPWTIVTTLAAGTTGIEVRLAISYVNGSNYYRKTWGIRNNGNRTFNSLSLTHGGDTSFAGDDYAAGHWDPRLRMVFLSNPGPGIAGVMGMYGATGSRAAGFSEGYYTDVLRAIRTATMTSAVVPGYHDAAYALKWERDSLAPGDVWVIEAFEKCTLARSLLVAAPFGRRAALGDRISYRFVVCNHQPMDDTIQLQALSSNGWPVQLAGGDTVSIGPYQSMPIDVVVTVPFTATAGSTDRLTVRANSVSRPALRHSDQVVTTVQTGEAGPQPLTGDVNGDGVLDETDYHLVSLPGIVPANPDPLAIFAGLTAYDPNQLRLFGHDTFDDLDPATGQYREYPDAGQVAPGAGFWLITRQDLEIRAQGVPISTTQPFPVALFPGWNLVGYPFLDPQDAANLMVRIGSFVVPVADISNTWVDHTAWGYGMGYFPVDLATGRVNPWTAYWFRNSSDQIVELLFPGSGGQPNALLGPAPLAPQPARQGLALSFKQRHADHADRTVFLGLDPRAARGPDPLDALTPPRVSWRAPRIFVDHRPWAARPGAYAVDMRPARDYPIKFPLRLEVPASTRANTYVLSWKGQASIPAGIKLRLEDTGAGLLVDMRACSSYSINVAAGRTQYPLKVIFSR